MNPLNSSNRAGGCRSCCAARVAALCLAVRGTTSCNWSNLGLISLIAVVA